jgi:hypothetical protein
MRLSRSVLRRLLALVAIAVLALYQYYAPAPDGQPAEPRSTPSSQQAGIAEKWRAGQWVEVTGTVQRMLKDDNEGSRHQRFILQLPERRTLLIAHNIDLAERVPLRQGDSVRLRGRYESNDRGGVIHWTHHDPQGFTSGGWIEYNGARYR